MTINGSGTPGPSSPSPGPAGFSHGSWVVYRAGDYIVCPGYGMFDRRTETRGDRRRTPRPCTYTFGRVQRGTVALVRVVPTGERADAPPHSVVHHCPACRAAVLLHLTAAKAA